MLTGKKVWFKGKYSMLKRSKKSQYMYIHLLEPESHKANNPFALKQTGQLIKYLNK